MLSWVRKLAAKLHRRRLLQTTVDELSALDDAVLLDIGIERSLIRSVVKGLISEGEGALIQPARTAKAPLVAAEVRAPIAREREHKAAA